jgi:putative heme degradation protein
MRKSPACALVAASVLAALAPTDAPSATRVEFEGFIHSCGGTDPEVVRLTPGGTLHLRRATNANEWVTNNPALDGPETNEVISLNVNPKGHGNVTLHSTLRPAAFDGTWDITVKVTITENGLVAHGVGHGTGELRGMTVKFTLAPALAVPNPCSEEGSLPVSGVVISPGS